MTRLALAALMLTAPAVRANPIVIELEQPAEVVFQSRWETTAVVLASAAVALLGVWVARRYLTTRG